MKEENKPKCCKCGSGQTYFRIATNERVCRVCGNVEIVKNKECKEAKDESKKNK